MRWVGPAAYLLGIGWYFATCVVIGVVGGRWLDGRFGTAPLFVLIGIFVGLAAAFYGCYRMLIRWVPGVSQTPGRPGRKT